jgi:23S rRNA pseudouridine2605 synthase
MRLQRALARAGVASRRAAEDLIRDDKVRVNGAPAHLGMSVDTDSDVITVQGRRVTQAPTVWVALHKPLGYVVTRADPEGRETVFKLVPDIPGLTYVGRLDVMTSGLLLLTTDGNAAHRLMHPKFEVERSYRVVVHGMSEDAIRSAFAKGIVIDRRPVNVVNLKIRPADEGRRGALELLLILKEGRYRIVRRICEQLGLKVERLIRLSYGPIRLGPMAPGTWRYLEKREVAALSGERIGGAVHRDLDGSVERRDRRSGTAGESRAEERTGEPQTRRGPGRPADKAGTRPGVERGKSRFAKPGRKRSDGPPNRRSAGARRPAKGKPRKPTRKRDW